MTTLVTAVHDYTTGPTLTLTGHTPIANIPLTEDMGGGMRNDHKTGLTPTYDKRFGTNHQRTFEMRPQGVSKYNGLILVSWYFRQSAAQYGTKIAVIDPVTNKLNSIGLVQEVNGELVPVEKHAGGIAIIGDYLYVADKFPRGLHVYDLSEIFTKVDNAHFLSGHPAFDEYDYILPKVGVIEITTPNDENVSFVSISGDGGSFVIGNYWKPNSGYTGVTSYIWKIPIDYNVASFPAAQVGFDCWEHEPLFRAGSNVGLPINRIQGALVTDTDVLILSRSDGSGFYQLLVHDLLREEVYFSGTDEEPEINDWKNWLYGCEDLCFTDDGQIGTVTEFYDWRDVAFFSLQDVIGLLGVYLPPTIAEHQAELATLQTQIDALTSEAAFYNHQIITAISEGLDRFDRLTYLI